MKAHEVFVILGALCMSLQLHMAPFYDTEGIPLPSLAFSLGGGRMLTPLRALAASTNMYLNQEGQQSPDPKSLQAHVM